MKSDFCYTTVHYETITSKANTLRITGCSTSLLSAGLTMGRRATIKKREIMFWGNFIFPLYFLMEQTINRRTAPLSDRVAFVVACVCVYTRVAFCNRLVSGRCNTLAYCNEYDPLLGYQICFVLKISTDVLT